MGYRVLMAMLCVLATQPAGGGTADSLFQAAVSDSSRPIRERIDLLKRALKANRNHADALHALGRLYTEQNTVASRALARLRLAEAIRLAPDRVAFHFSYATLLRKQGFYYNSMRRFKEILEMDPDCADAACEVGNYLLQDMLKYVDSPRFDGGGSMRSFGLESRDEAAAYFQYAIERDPYCREAYYRLGFLSLESGHPGGLVRVSEALLRRYPGDAHGLLFLGLGHQVAGDEAAAYDAYRQALERMGEEERRVMESVDEIAGREERLALGIADTGDGAVLPDAVLGRFWGSRDPLLLTRFNERRMAHYGRVAYADLRFSRPDEGVAGWETDMGRIYIRYGRYLERRRTIGPYREVWRYEDFEVSFYSFDSVHWWVELLRDANWLGSGGVGGYGRGEVFSPEFHLQERYVDPYRDQKYPLPCMVGLFKAPEGRVRVDLAFALPKEKLDYLKLYDTYQVDLEEGVFVSDSSAADGPGVRQVRRKDVLRETWQDTLRGRYLLDRASVTLPGGVAPLTVEVRDSRRRTIGTFLDTLDLQPFEGPHVALSSVVLATGVTEREDAEGRRFDVTPNPVRIYRRDEVLYLYFEVYNLAQDAYGQTRYRVEYRIGTPRLKRLPMRMDRKTREALGLDEAGWTTSVTSDYRGGRADDALYLGIDLGELKPGLQLLTLVVTDASTGLSAGRETLFRVVE